MRVKDFEDVGFDEHGLHSEVQIDVEIVAHGLEVLYCVLQDRLGAGHMSSGGAGKE